MHQLNAETQMDYSLTGNVAINCGSPGQSAWSGSVCKPDAADVHACCAACGGQQSFSMYEQYATQHVILHG